MDTNSFCLAWQHSFIILLEKKTKSEVAQSCPTLCNLPGSSGPSRNTPSPSCSCSPAIPVSLQSDSWVMHMELIHVLKNSCPLFLLVDPYSCSAPVLSMLVSLPYLLILWRAPFSSSKLFCESATAGLYCLQSKTLTDRSDHSFFQALKVLCLYIS